MMDEVVTATGREYLGLKEILLYGTKRFGQEVAVLDGHTLFNGTNGAGKTSLLRAVLFFYGAHTKRQLGIAEEQSSWVDYMYPHSSNAMVFYRYRGLHGEMMVISYREGNAINVRFAPWAHAVDFDALMFTAAGVLRDSAAVLGRLQELGVACSDEVRLFVGSESKGTQKYMAILYGGKKVLSGKDARFAEYAMVHASGDYAMIREMMLSVYLNANSTVASGTVERAIASMFDQVQPLNLDAISGTFTSTLALYRNLRVFHDKRTRIDSILDARTVAEDAQATVLEQAGILSANLAYYEGALPELGVAFEAAEAALESGSASAEAQDREAGAKVRELTELFGSKNGELQRLRSLEASCQKRAPEMQRAKDEAKEEPALLLSSQRIEKEIATLHRGRLDIKQAHEGFMADLKNEAVAVELSIRNETAEAVDANARQRDELQQQQTAALQAIEEGMAPDMERADAALTDARAKWMEQQKRHARLQSSDGIASALKPIDDTIAVEKEALQKATLAQAQTQRDLQGNARDREACEADLERAEHDHSQRQRLESQPLVAEKNQLEGLIGAQSDTLLGFVREHAPQEQETRFTALLKEKVLLHSADALSAAYDPRASDSLLGLRLDTAVLLDGEEGLQGRLEDVNRKIEALRQRYAEQLKARQGEINGVLRELGKAHLALSEQSGRDGREVLRLEKRLHELNDQRATESQALKQRHAAALTASKAELDRCESAFNDASQARAEIEAGAKRRRQREQQRFSVLFNENAKAKARLRAEEASRLAKVRGQSAARVEACKAEYAQQLAENGIDAKSIRAREQDLEAIKGRLEAIRTDAPRIVAYDLDLIACAAILPLADAVADLGAKKEEAETNREELADRWNATLEDLKRQRDAKQQAMAHARTQVDVANAAMERLASNAQYARITRSGISGGGARAEQDSSVLENAIFQAINSFEAALLALQRGMSELNGKFVPVSKGTRGAGWSYHDGSTEAILQSARALWEHTRGEGLALQEQLVAESIISDCRSIGRLYTGFTREMGQIRKIVSKVNRLLGQSVENIEILQSITVETKSAVHPVLQGLEELEQAELPLGYNTLFSEGNSEEGFRNILTLFESLVERIGKEQRREIRLEDTFDIMFRVVQVNGDDTGWVPSRKTIGSTGTSLIIKTVTYLALMRTIVDATKSGSAPVRYHILLDEIGQLDTQNLREIIAFADTLDISILNAAPGAKASLSYKNLYVLKILGQRSSIHPLHTIVIDPERLQAAEYEQA